MPGTTRWEKACARNARPVCVCVCETESAQASPVRAPFAAMRACRLTPPSAPGRAPHRGAGPAHRCRLMARLDARSGAFGTSRGARARAGTHRSTKGARDVAMAAARTACDVTTRFGDTLRRVASNYVARWKLARNVIVFRGREHVVECCFAVDSRGVDVRSFE